jgi:hypothetical protein
MINVTRSSMPSYEEYCSEIKSLWSNHWLTNMGVKHQQLQEKLKDYLKVDNLELIVNGHMSLELILQTMDFRGGEVITTPFTFASTAHAIVRSGLKPVFCDINEQNYTMDADKIEEKITDKTVAIMPVHVYGNICDVEKIQDIADKYGLKVIYDAAHAFGVQYKGKGIGAYGDASCFSFHATKVFNTIEGGAVCFADEHIQHKLCELRDFGIRDEEHVDRIGTNGKMNEFAAAMGLCNLRHIDEEIKKREKIVKCYRKYLENTDGIQLNPIQEDVVTNYAYFPIVLDDEALGITRDDVYNTLRKNDINARKYFYPIISMFDCYKEQYDAKETPVALKISERVLTLPLYADLPYREVDKICKIILECIHTQESI